MPERTSYEPGTPSWVDLSTPDPAGAKRFYGELFGWDAQDAGPVEETGGYAMFLLDGKPVAGVGPTQGEGQPPAWSTYVATDDADAVAERARAAGAQVLMEPMDVMDAGRLAFFAHPAGGTIGVWQAGRHTGAAVVNEPGTVTWNELQTRDTEAGKRFGEAVFGWTANDADMNGFTYTVFNLGDRGIAGMVAMPPGVPDEVPAFWLTYFAVEDADDALRRITELGGAVTTPVTELEGVGRFATGTDPQGAHFAVIKTATTG